MTGSKSDESDAPELIKTIRWLLNRSNWRGSWPFIVIAAVIVVSPIAWDYRSKMREREEHDRPIYSTLRDNLRNLDRAVGNITALRRVITDPKANTDLISGDIAEAEVAAKPLCDARQEISELDDEPTRNDLDVICFDVETMRRIVIENPRGAIDTAVALNHQLIRKACEKVISHVSGKISDCSDPR